MRLLITLIFLLAACQQIGPLPDEGFNYTRTEEDVRPEIPRGYEPPEEEIPARQPTGSERPVLLDDPTPRVELKLPIGEPLSDSHPIVMKYEFPLLGGKAVPLGNGVATYDQEIRFRNSSGRITFARDPVTEEIGTHLAFEGDRPIFTYVVRLHDATWTQLSGRDIELLGHTYVVAEATNHTVAFFGRDVDSNLLFDDGDHLVVDSNGRLDTRAFVRPHEIGYVLLADGPDSGGDIILSPGESLRENLHGDDLASRFLNVRYAGLGDVPVARLRLDRTEFGYDLIADTPQGEVRIPLVEEDAGMIVLGEVGRPLHVEDCPLGAYCIAPDSYVLLSRNGRTFVLEYSDVSLDPDRIIFRMPGTRYSYEFLGRPGKDAFADVIVGGERFRARIGPHDNATGRANISIDIPRSRIYTAAGAYLEIHEIEDDTLPLELVVPRTLTLDREERTWINLTFDGEWRITVGNMSLAESEDSDETLGLTPYGAAFLLDRKQFSGNEADELEIVVPAAQALGTVRLEG